MTKTAETARKHIKHAYAECWCGKMHNVGDGPTPGYEYEPYASEMTIKPGCTESEGTMNRLEEAHQLAEDLIELTDLPTVDELLFIHTMQDATTEEACSTNSMEFLRELHRKYIGGQP
jgi:hypothetical protein